MSRQLAVILLCASVASSAGSCDGDDENPGSSKSVADFALEHHHYTDADILFVIDNSGSMTEEQASLTSSFPRFMNVLENLDGGLPDLHIGVVSTDLGVGPYDVTGCSGSGDNGTLQSEPHGSCPAPNGAFISDVADGVGGRITNYTGTLTETFACIARLGIDGCGFEQPLESMKRALDGSNPTNAGFLRPDALLSVIFVTDEDDCSAFDTGLFDDANSDLGPLSSFRCFELGVVCDPDTPRAAGPHSNCAPRDDSAYLYGVDHYASFLQGLKVDPDMILVTGIFGNPTPVAVTLDEDDAPALEPSCKSTAGEAAPAVRLAGLVAALPESSAETICTEDLSDAEVRIAQQIAERLSPDDLRYHDCLSDAPYDDDPATDGIQPRCDVTLIGADSSETALPACNLPADPANSTNLPCYRLQESASCSPSGWQIESFHAQVPATGTRIEVSCLVQ